ncbi:MAG TPA: galactokinase [Dehalococcoidia bacterium]|nr:galactokinase [Dehalococcoidia bacterium]
MTADRPCLPEAFTEGFGRPPQLVAEAPGRVNLIGEHTDYNEGFVLPVAIDRTVAVAAAARDDSLVSVRSLDYGEDDEFWLDEIPPIPGWRGYVRGVAWAMREDGQRLRGADLLVSGDVPQGAGLSSSAAIEVAVAGALAAVVGLELPRRQIARLARRAENDFVGVPCGIMDQFASALSRAGHALLIDCRSETVEHIPLPFERDAVEIVVVDSKVPRRLGETAYSVRQQECREAAKLLGVASLRDVDGAIVGRRRDRLPDAVYRRARHVASENARVLAAADALRDGDADRFGTMMYESHGSLRDDFEVSCPELDLLVELASKSDGVAGARLTGAGFGGCTVNLVRGDSIDSFRAQVIEKYQKKTGLGAEMHVCRAAGGLKVTDV